MATDNRQPISSFRLEPETLANLRAISQWLGSNNLTAAIRFAARETAEQIRDKTTAKPARKKLQKSA